MRTRKVITWKCLPTRLPIWSSITLYLLLEHIHAPGWAWGMLGGFYAIIWILAFYEFFTQKQITPREFL